jgi:hypothetical protein
MAGDDQHGTREHPLRAVERRSTGAQSEAPVFYVRRAAIMSLRAALNA